MDIYFTYVYRENILVTTLLWVPESFYKVCVFPSFFFFHVLFKPCVRQQWKDEIVLIVITSLSRSFGCETRAERKVKMVIKMIKYGHYVQLYSTTSEKIILLQRKFSLLLDLSLLLLWWKLLVVDLKQKSVIELAGVV